MKCIFSLFCILFLSIAQTTGFVPRQPIINRGDLYVSNNLAANSIKIIGRDSFFKCHNLYSKNLITSNYNSQFVKGNNLYLKNIYPYKGDSTYILGLVTVKGDLGLIPEGSGVRNSFIQTNMIKINGENQWILIENDVLLKGKWLEHHFINKTSILYRDFKVNAHEFIKIEANFHFIGDIWKGQAVLLQYNDEILWLDHHEWETDMKDNIWISPINVVIKTDIKDFRIKFVSIGGTENDFWVENFNLYIK